MCNECLIKYLPFLPVEEFRGKTCAWVKALVICLIQFRDEQNGIKTKNTDPITFHVTAESSLNDDCLRLGDQFLDSELLQAMVSLASKINRDDTINHENEESDDEESNFSSECEGYSDNFDDSVEEYLADDEYNSSGANGEQFSPNVSFMVDQDCYGFPYVSHEEIVHDGEYDEDSSGQPLEYDQSQEYFYPYNYSTSDSESELFISQIPSHKYTHEVQEEETSFSNFQELELATVL